MIFPRLPDVNFDDIANHYGWSKVDERRTNFIIKHVVDYAFDEAFEEIDTTELYDEYTTISKQILSKHSLRIHERVLLYRRPLYLKVYTRFTYPLINI